MKGKNQDRLDEALKKLNKKGFLDPNDMRYASIDVRNAELKMKAELEEQKKTKTEIDLKLYLTSLNITS